MTVYVVVTYDDGSESYGYAIEGVALSKAGAQRIIDDAIAREEQADWTRWKKDQCWHKRPDADYRPCVWKDFPPNDSFAFGVNNGFETNIEAVMVDVQP